MEYDDYHTFWMARMSYTAQPTEFTKEEIQWAIKQTEYKYFGDYEFSHEQKMAVDILVWFANSHIKDM